MNQNNTPVLNPLEAMSLADLRQLQRTSQSPIERHAAAAEEATRYRSSSDRNGLGGCEGNARAEAARLRGRL